MVDYDTLAETCAPDDFWGQVRRTVGGKPVGQDQIDLIVDAAARGLRLDDGDVVLDLCCGNGALSRLLFERCSGGMGVDISKALIRIAKTNFEIGGREEYLEQDAVEFTRTYEPAGRFTKALCYGSFAYLDRDQGLEMLRAVAERFVNVSRVFVGNLPDRARMGDFFRPGAYTPGIENDARSDIGLWWDQAEFAALGREAGWDVEIARMPPSFYAAHYRYDVVLTRPRG